MYYVIELQTTGDAPASIVQTRADKNEALSVFHGILAFAATSSVDYHTCVVMDEQGRYIARECFDHTPPVQPGEEA